MQNIWDRKFIHYITCIVINESKPRLKLAKSNFGKLFIRYYTKYNLNGNKKNPLFYLSEYEFLVDF